MGHLFKYHLLPDNRKTEDLPSSNLTHLVHVQRCSLISFMFRDVNFVISDGPYSVIYSGVLLSSEPCGSWSL